MARQVVSKNSLLKIEGLDKIISKIEKIIDNTSGGKAGKELKKNVYVPAAKVVSNQVRAAIENIDGSQSLRDALAASVATNEGKESQPNAIVIVSQPIGVRRLPKGTFVPNPYWYEYGTAPRYTNNGANRGKIQPQPFFRGAVEASRDKAKQVLIEGLKKLIEK